MPHITSNKRRQSVTTKFALLVVVTVLAGCGGSNSDSASSTPVAQAPVSGAAQTPVAGVQMPGSAGTGVLTPNSDEATYRITFNAQWTQANGFGEVPGSAHFSPVIGSAVNDSSNLWLLAQPSSFGMENLAEEGTIEEFTAEIRAEANGNAAAAVQNLGGTLSDNSVAGEVTFSQEFPLFTFASMVAPSPDWFVGLSQFSLLDDNGQWREQVSLDLPVYDAGTEDGDGFMLGGAASNPQGLIELLSGTVAGSLNFVDGLVNGQAIARIDFERIR